MRIQLFSRLVFALLIAFTVTAAPAPVPAQTVAPTTAPALALIPAQQPDHLLEGVIDFHCHSGPDVLGRLINDFELVRQAKAAGMRAIVLKNHYTMTADRAQLAMQEIGGIQVYGGITLNRSVGGLNAEAVRKMIQMDGRRGKVVWLPTYDGEAQVRQSGENRPFIAVVRDGKPVPELAEIFDLIARNNLVFETGHSSVTESVILVDAAKKAGISRIVVTHVLSDPGTPATDDQLKQLADMGAIVECTWLGQLPGAQLKTVLPSPPPDARANDAGTVPAAGKPAGNPRRVTIAEYARVIRLIGADHVLISSDMGQMLNPPHVKAMRDFILALKAEGITDEQIDQVARKNPARLLGLDP